MSLQTRNIVAEAKGAGVELETIEHEDVDGSEEKTKDRSKVSSLKNTVSYSFLEEQY